MDWVLLNLCKFVKIVFHEAEAVRILRKRLCNKTDHIRIEESRVVKRQGYNAS